MSKTKQEDKIERLLFPFKIHMNEEVNVEPTISDNRKKKLLFFLQYCLLCL